MARIDDNSYETGSENESGRNDEDQPGPSKRAKLTKFKGAAVYYTKFNATWTKEHPFTTEVKGDVCSFLCTIYLLT